MNNDPDQFGLRLDAIETKWSLVQRAHHAIQVSGDSETARKTLVLRYAAAIRNYVCAIVRNEDDADEVAQDVFLRLMNGDFAGADPNRGRFRDLIKTATRNMVKNVWAARSRRKESSIDKVPEFTKEENIQLDKVWTHAWRDSVLSIAWSRLEQYEKNIDGNISYTLLRLRTDQPDWSINQIAQHLSAKTDRQFNENALRQQLRRARIRFAEFVVEEIAQGLPDSNQQRVVDELINLELYESVKEYLPDQSSD